ncbi:zinc finger CCHC domain-containing protein 12-like [Etheostoma cragini]|uniref:zinc finger CCHC domain-containing protein 12-like n=1 Tax=Etheostoma cragini TaxID=417921 RepID=UPI00155EA47F|nr:zinc finger CCHC domain-containing protein 12-like [Etheostoma cragini]
MYDPQGQSLTVLCECKEEVNTKTIPPNVLPEGSDLPWRIFGPGEEENVSTDTQSTTITPEQQPIPGMSFPLQASTPEAIIRAVGDIMQRTSKSASDSSSFRRLRTFSGVIPTPSGEEQLDNWIEQARLMIEECDRPDREKRMKIMESVKGPALEILQAVCFNNPEATPHDYIDVIENTFGTPETGEELYFAFRMLCQHPHEKLSAFLRRMEKLLNKVIQKGGLPSTSADKARLDQLIKGGTRADMMLINLRLRERRARPPTFLQLLSEIRTEEEYEASRHKLNPTKPVHVKTVMTPAEAEIKDLRAEVQELKLQVTEITACSTMPSSQSNATEFVVSPEAEASMEDKDIQALKKEVKRLRKQVSIMSVKPATEAYEARPSQGFPAINQQKKGSFQRPSRDFFCYRCGEEGHVATKCSAPENHQKVIQKLIRAQRQLRGSQLIKSMTTPAADTHDANVRKSTANVQTDHLPEGLVGPPSTACVKVEGRPCTALLDSGSQVTIIFDSWYAKHLTHIPIHPVSGLNLWGLSEAESSYPYRGYIQVKLELPKKKPGKVRSVPVLALVCPDPRCSDNIPVLVGKR